VLATSKKDTKLFCHQVEEKEKIKVKRFHEFYIHIISTKVMSNENHITFSIAAD